ncbi:MAG: lipoyl protein ligase domain-containing protein [Candidatus Rhabdochlamydia sp.]
METAECRIIHTGRKSAEENMRFDAELLEKAKNFFEPIIHFYEWESPSATYGYFANPASLLFLDQIGSLDLAKRPTGGGVIFHIWDFAFSIMVPASSPLYSSNTLNNYALINTAVLSSIESFLEKGPCLHLTPQDAVALSGDCKHFCMAKPTQYDVLLRNKKIAGAAQRKTKNGFLHQGSICLQLPDRNYLNQVIRSKEVIDAMYTHTFPLLGDNFASESQIKAAKTHLQTLLTCDLNRVCLKYSQANC